MNRNTIIPIEGSDLVKTGGQFLETPEPTNLIKYKGIPKIGQAIGIPKSSKQTKYKLEPALLDREQKPTIKKGQLEDEYDSFEAHQIYVSTAAKDIYKKEGLWDSIIKYNDLLDERAANIVGYDKEMSQDELDANYINIVRLRADIIKNSALIDIKYPEGIPNDVNSPVADDADATVDYSVNNDIDTSMLEGVGTERATVVDPAEVSLFLNTNAEARRQQQIFNQFSRVLPGNSLGSMKDNTLRQHNAMSDAKQFSHSLATAPRYNPTLGREYNSPTIVPSLQAVEHKNRNNQNQPYRINVMQSTFGKVDWEAEGFAGNNLMSGHFTAERVNSSNYRAYDNPYSIYHPELELSRYKSRPVAIPELRNDGFNFGLHNAKPSTEGNILYGNKQNGYDFKPLMRGDKYGSNTSVKSSLDVGNQRIISSRM
jgi:hypothetical protein